MTSDLPEAGRPRRMMISKCSFIGRLPVVARPRPGGDKIRTEFMSDSRAGVKPIGGRG